MVDAAHGGAFPPELHPALFIPQLEAISMSKARAGVAQAIGDIIEQTMDWSPVVVASADSQLAAAGLPTLTEVRLLSGKAMRALVKRGRARNETEFYLAKGLVDGCADQIAADDLAVLTKIVSDFEGA